MTDRELKQMEKIPVKLRGRVEEVEFDPDNDMGRWWVYLADGWRCDTSAADHTIHEDTWKDCMRHLRGSTLCSCRQCVPF